MATEAEILRAWIADRPLAGLVREMKDGDTAALGQINKTKGLWLRQGDLALHRFDPHKSF